MTLRSPGRRDFMRYSGALAGSAAFSPGAVHAAEVVMDFRGRMPSGVQFRRNSPATYSGDDGIVRYVEAEVPRFPKNRGKPAGLLIEGQATNYLINASRPNLKGWSPGSGAIGSLLDGINAPDGNPGAFSLPRGAPAQNHLYDAVTANSPHADYGTASVWLRSKGGSGKWRMRLRDFKTYNGAATVVEVGAEWRRYQLGFAWQVKDTGAKRFSLLDNEPVRAVNTPPVYALNRVNPYEKVSTPLSLDSVLMWGAQYETGNAAGSFIPTQDVPATRMADEVTFPATAMNLTEGTVTVVLPEGGRRGGVILDSAGERGGLRLGYSNSGWITARVGTLELAGFGDVTGDRIVRLEWSQAGAQISTGNRMSALTRQAAERHMPGKLKLSETVRLGMAGDGTQALGRVLATLTVSPVAGAIATVELPILVPVTYTESFLDDFDSDDLSRINENASGSRAGAPAWRSRYRQGRHEVINKEKQVYMDAQFSGTAKAPLGIQPFSIRDGILRIRADKADPGMVAPHIWNYRYTSGCISSELTYWQMYGYFEIRARLPRGKGYWPAFWLLPKRDAWPPEIDILEGSGARPYGIHHGVIEKPRKTSTPGGMWIDQFIDASDGFHRYAVDWTRENIIFYVDGIKTFEYGPHGIHEDMYMLVNLALGSKDANWIPDPDDTTPFPGFMEIDYVQAARRRT
jgi:hypothetical protein